MRIKEELLQLYRNRAAILAIDIEAERFEPFWHFHTEYELTLLTVGHGTRYVGNRIQPYDGPELVLIGTNLPHMWVSAPDSIQNSATIVQFSGRIFPQLYEMKEIQELLALSQQGLLFRRIDKVISIMDGLSNASGAMQISALIAILHELARTNQFEVLSTSKYNLPLSAIEKQSRSERVFHYTLKHLNRRLTVGELATQAHMTPESFCRWFKQVAGVSFITFVNTSRVENATFQLTQSKKTIKQIAYDSGFDSISQFNRAFKQTKGQTASKFRSGSTV